MTEQAINKIFNSRIQPAQHTPLEKDKNPHNDFIEAQRQFSRPAKVDYQMKVKNAGEELPQELKNIKEFKIEISKDRNGEPIAATFVISDKRFKVNDLKIDKLMCSGNFYKGNISLSGNNHLVQFYAGCRGENNFDLYDKNTKKVILNGNVEKKEQ